MTNVEKGEHSDDEQINWFGFSFTKYNLYGLGILFFAIGYFGISESERKLENIYALARPVSERIEGKPVYATGEIKSEEIGSEFIKPGKYFKILQSSEVYAWYEHETSKGNRSVNLGWVESPEDPKNFRFHSDDAKPFYGKKINLKPIYNETVTLVNGIESYKIDVDKVDFLFGLNKDPEAPGKENLIPGKYPFIGKSTLTTNRNLTLYENSECESEPKANCQRVVLSVLPSVDGEHTVIGDVKEGKIVPFNDEIRIGKGDLATTLDKYSFHTGLSNFWSYIRQGFLFLGIWFGLYIARHQFLKFIRIKNLSDTKSLGLLAIILTITIKIFYNYFFVFSFVCVGLFLFASREERK